MDISFKTENEILYISILGRIDSANAPDAEQSINEALQSSAAAKVVIDCEGLEYISSTGLRVILRLKKAVRDLKLINVLQDVYQVLDTTGFTRLMDVQKAYRSISVDGCELIGCGANGCVYRIDRETIVKVFSSDFSIDDIEKERELARTAFILGIPTAIPYDVVRISEGGYGSVFELLDAESFAQLLISGKKTVSEIVTLSVDLLKTIHSTEADPGSMPDMRQVAMGWADMIKEYISPEAYEKLCRLIENMPEDRHMIHGDFHLKNVMLQGEEALLIDMDSLACGHPVFELAGMYNTYCAFRELDGIGSESFLGIPRDISSGIWRETLKLYLNSSEEEYLRSVEEKAMLLGYARLLRREVRLGAQKTEAGKRGMEIIITRLEALLSRTDSLDF